MAEVAARLRVSEVTVYRRISDGTLAAVRLGAHGPIRVPATALKHFLVLAHERAGSADAPRTASAAVEAPAHAGHLNHQEVAA